MSPIRPCAEPACPEPAAYRGRCRTHQRQHQRDTPRAGASIYRKAKWARTRERILTDQPLCPCGQIATDVHHQTDLADGGDPWHPNNLQPLCRSCHAQITRARQQHGR